MGYGATQTYYITLNWSQSTHQTSRR